MWSASPETEKYHIFLTIFEKPQQYQEQILSIPQLLTPPLPGWLPLLLLPVKKGSELAAEMFCLSSFCQLARHHLLDHMRVVHLSQSATGTGTGMGMGIACPAILLQRNTRAAHGIGDTEVSAEGWTTAHGVRDMGSQRDLSSAVVRWGRGSGALEHPCPCPAWCPRAGVGVRGRREVRWLAARAGTCLQMFWA